MNDILDKILLANSLIDHANIIFLVGEIGLASISALGINVSKVERIETSAKQIEEYNAVKPFFMKLFEKALERKVKIVPPVDFEIAVRYDAATELARVEAQKEAEALAAEQALNSKGGKDKKGEQAPPSEDQQS